MNLIEIYNTRQDLDWTKQGDEHLTKFQQDDVRYGVVVTIEESRGLRFGRVDFHVEEEDGSLRFDASAASPSVYSVLGIVTNGVIEQFGDLDGIYFVAKKALYPDEYEQRVRIYGKIAHRLHLRLKLGMSFINRPEESISILTRNTQALDVLHDLLDEELKEQP